MDLDRKNSLLPEEELEQETMKGIRTVYDKAGKAHKRKNKYAIAGGILLILAVVGIVSLVVFSIKFTQTMMDDSKQTAKLERYLQPVVMFDPLPFESIKESDPLVVLQSALWYTLMNEPEDQQSFDDFGMRVLKASDVDASGQKLFGSALKLEHQSFGDFDVSYIYEERQQVYKIPVTGIMATYKAKVISLSKSEGGYQVIVGYVPTGSEWMTDLDGNAYEAQPDKYLKYILKKEKKQYYIASIQQPEEGEAPPVTGPGVTEPVQTEAK